MIRGLASGAVLDCDVCGDCAVLADPCRDDATGECMTCGAESVCTCCERPGHTVAQCPETDRDEPDSRDCDTIEESLGTWGAGGR